MIPGIVLLVVVSLMAHPAGAAAEPAYGLSRLEWLAGCWQGEAGEECWLAPRDGLMIAVNRSPSRAGEWRGFEQTYSPDSWTGQD